MEEFSQLIETIRLGLRNASRLAYEGDPRNALTFLQRSCALLDDAISQLELWIDEDDHRRWP